MTKRTTGLLWCTSLLGIFIASTLCQSATAEKSETTSGLVALASAQFPNLTKAERAMLEHADVKNVGRGEFAVAGLSANPHDPSNDPKDAGKWDAQREIRARLIRWMCVDPDAIRQIDPAGRPCIGRENHRNTGPVASAGALRDHAPPLLNT